MLATGKSNSALITDTNVQEYFKDTVSSALSNQKVQADEDTVFYLVNLLADSAHAERWFEQSPDGVMLQPLALHYARAVQAGRLEDRRRSLKRLGDLALLIAGLFPDSLNRKAVDLDYYVAMGRSAYGHLSDTALRPPALRGIFGELAAKFQVFVDVLGEVGEDSRLGSSVDVLRLYEAWARTGSRRTAGKLRALGIEPIGGSISRRRN